jgi:hypothetical protein
MSGKKTDFAWVSPRPVSGWGFPRSTSTENPPMPITLFRPFSFIDLLFAWPTVPIDLDF